MILSDPGLTHNSTLYSFSSVTQMLNIALLFIHDDPQ